MSRAPLRCPFQGLCPNFIIPKIYSPLFHVGCERVTFSRGASQLENHFKEIHTDLMNKVITVPSDLMLPISVPYSPLPHDLPPPPPLPKYPTLGCLFVPAVRGTQIRCMEGPPLSQISQASQASPRKRLKLHQQVAEETSPEPSSIFFDDFETQIDKNGEFIGTVGCIIGQTVGPRLDVARPQPILDPTQFGLKSPPRSIHYNIFSDQFDEMVRAAAKGNMPIVPISMQTSSTIH